MQKTDAELIAEAEAYVSSPKSFSDCWKADDFITELARRLKAANEELQTMRDEMYALTYEMGRVD